MRYLLGFLCMCALGIVPLVGCSETGGLCTGTVCRCTEQGILAAIAAGGGPYTFDCDGPTTVMTQAEVVIDNDVILDGEGNLAVHGDHSNRVFSVPEGITAQLHGLTATRGSGGIANEGTLTIQDCAISQNWTECCDAGGGIRNAGAMTVINSTVSGNHADHGSGGGIYNGGEMTIINSTVSDNAGDPDGWGPVGGGIYNAGAMTIINCTVSGNRAESPVGLVSGGGIYNGGTLTLANSTVSGNDANSGDAISIGLSSHTEIANTLIDGDCGVGFPPGTPDIASNGYNIESPDNTCGSDQTGDQVSVTEEELNLGELADNGGSTMTHALGDGSVAIDVIPADMCEEETDQRGFLRPEKDGTMCDVGAFEVQRIVTCFQDDECSPMICCHLGSPFEPGTCETQAACDELQGGG